MTVKEKAVSFHGSGLNCAQSVLISLETYTQLPEEIAKRIAEGFGGGVRCGEICGSVSGAIMALGLVKERPIADEVKEFTELFRQAQGCLRCAELLEKFGGKGHCDDLIGFCAEEMEKRLK